MEAETERREDDILELAAHLPDLVLQASNSIQDYPAVQHVESVVMFLDIWGFTSLCERHTKLNLGVDILTKTLNDYLGLIENAILKNGGDVVEFAGDALLVLWDVDLYGQRAAMARAIRCARQIQRKCHDWTTDSGISLALKIALAVGQSYITYVGCHSCRHYSTSGPAVNEANRTEKRCSRGSIVLSQQAWETCPDRTAMSVEELPEGERKLLSVEKEWAETELDPVRKDFQTLHDALKQGQKLEREPRIRKINFKSVHRSKMRPFIAPPVLSKFDENQSLDYLCEMREVTVVFINLHMDSAHDHSTCLQSVYDKIHTSVSQFQGMINKIFEFDKGTSFLVLFGLPGFKHEHEACHAVQCAGQIKDVVSSMIEVKQISIGVTTGKVFCGVVGHNERHEYTVIGPKVNMAARLMMHYIGKVTCDEVTKKRSRNDSRGFIRVANKELKGIDDPGMVWEYTGAGNVDNSIPEYGYPLLSYVEEFEQCWKSLWRMASLATNSSSTIHQPARFIVIGGDPGVGKTRLLRSVMDTAKGMNMAVYTCRPSVGQSSTPYHTICSVVLQLLDLQDIGSPQEREHRLQERFEDTELFWHLCLLNDLLGIQIPVTDEIADLSQRERTQARHAVLAYIVSEARNRDSAGTLIAIDDAHYIDQDSWTYLEALPSKYCLVALAMGSFRRDAEVPIAASRILQARSTLHIKLQGLEPQCMEPLLCQLLEMDSVPRELTIMLTSHQGNRINPSWVNQCVFNMLHHQQLELYTEGERTVCRVAKGVRLMELDIPPSLRGCMIAFIDRLPELQRTTVKIISVVGTSFTADIIAHLMPNVIQEKINPTIGSLQSAGILVFGSGGALPTVTKSTTMTAGSLRFQSVTLQETAYALLLEKQRRKLHERYATYLENNHLSGRKGEISSPGGLSPAGIKKLLGIKTDSKQRDDNSNNILCKNDEQSLQSVYPQLVTHWKKANNLQRAIHYMVYGAESAVALGYNMQAISFIFQAKKLNPSPVQLRRLDELATKATASLLFTKRRRSSSPGGAKFKWRNMAVKARNFERSLSVEEEETDDKVDVGGVGIVDVSPEEEIIPSDRYQTIMKSACPEFTEEPPPPPSRLTDDISHRCNGNVDTNAHSMNKMAGKLVKQTVTTYRISKYYIYAVCSVIVAFWAYLIMNRAISTERNST
ncbi:adenylate cyclase type 10-like [Lytechinus variegatus]|uniref:adenylate cyclase type 10-like n=1 Tax=Lytechinus variegatus TaxID=7654 RepID=UPI001BB24CC0|nr:adenylate cyclase type 10-like [Lytechinus variegatus]